MQEGELSLLIKLQSFDSALEELAVKAEDVNASILGKNKSLDQLKAGAKAFKEKAAALLLKKKQLEGEAENQEKLVKKHQAELNSLKSNDAYKAMLGEIEAAKKAQYKIEDYILMAMESLEQTEKDLKNHETQMKIDEAKIKSEIQNLESQKNSLLEESKKKKEERDAFASTVPAPLLNQYESIRRNKGNIAIVPMMNNACSGCRMNLTQNKMIEIKKAKNMVLCDSCSRILYLPPAENNSQTSPQSQTVPAS